MVLKCNRLLQKWQQRKSWQWWMSVMVTSEARSDGRSDELEVDDPDEHILEGSDDDFSDLPLVESEEEDEGFPDRSRVCTQTPPPTNNTTATNGPNSTIPPTIAANPLSPLVIVVVIAPLTTPLGLLLCILASSTPSLLPLVLLFQFLKLRWTCSHYSPKDHKCWLLTGSHVIAIVNCHCIFADKDTLVSRGSLGYDQLDKVWPVIDHLSKKFAELYQPHCEVGAILSETV